MIRTTLTALASAAALFAVSEPIDPPVSMAEISPSQCKLIRYGAITTVEKFPCDFRQAFGSVQVWSKNWNFEFPYKEQGKTTIRINRIPLTFTRTGQYTLEDGQ